MPLDRIGRNTLRRGTVLGGGYFWLLLGDRLALAENGEVEGWMKDCKKKDGDCYHPECKRDDGNCYSHPVEDKEQLFVLHERRAPAQSHFGNADPVSHCL